MYYGSYISPALYGSPRRRSITIMGRTQNSKNSKSQIMNRPITMQENLTAHGAVGPFLVTDLEGWKKAASSFFFFSLLLLSETQAWEREVAGWDPPCRSCFFLCLAVPNNAEIKWSVILLWSPSTEYFIYYYFFLYSFSRLLRITE